MLLGDWEHCEIFTNVPKLPRYARGCSSVKEHLLFITSGLDDDACPPFLRQSFFMRGADNFAAR